MTRTTASGLARAWRAWATAYLLMAVAWPAAGPLPWVVWDVHAAAAHAGSAGEAASHDHDEDAGIPGSPTHPADHNCAECQVLKHLSRCVLPDPCVVTVAPLAGGPEQIVAQVQRLHPSFTVAHPPIRGPPLLRA
jgi:hypothetical protein